MERSIQNFTSPEFGEIQTIDVNGKIYFPATRCAEILGYSNPHKAVIDHCKNAQKIEIECDLTNREGTSRARKTQEVNYIPEGDLYRLIAKSKLPSAEKFERWIFDEVLPAIRRQGFYLDPRREIDPDVVISLCNQIKEQRRKLELALEDNHILEQQVYELAPKANYYDLVLNCKDVVSVSEIAKDYGKTAQWLNDFLRKADVQYQMQGQKTWLLKSQYATEGYTQSKTHTYLGSDGENHTKMHTYWTQKGRLFIYHLLKAKGILPLIEREMEGFNGN